MRNIKHVFTFLCATLLSTALLAQADDSAAARAAATSWLASIDGGDYAASWESAASMFKSAISADAWTQAATRARSPLGALQSRSDKELTMATSLPGAPDGHYAVLQYDTVFANKATAVETLTLTLDGEQWKVAGYFIR